MSQWNQHGVYATPPGASGLPNMPQGQQTLPPNQYSGYSIDHLPPPPGSQQPAQGGSQPYGAQPGVPGAQIAQPLSTQQPGQQWGAQPPQQPQGWPQQPTTQGTPTGIPGAWPQQPQGQPQGQPQQQRPGTTRLDDNTILDGDAVPPELRGRTWGDARRLYSALSTDWLQRHGRPQTPASQTLQSQGFMQPQPGQRPQGQQPQGQPNGQPNGQPRDPRQFWQNPDERISEVVSQAIEQRLGPMLQPVLARNQQSAILEARQIAATGVRDFSYLEPDIMQIVARANPNDLQNPEVWQTAADMARGRRLAAGQYQPPQNGGQPQGQVPGRGPASPGSYGPGYSVPTNAAPPAPPVHSFFSESPSAPNVPGSYGSAGGAQASQEDYHYAQKFQMPVQDYLAWKHGAQPAGAGGSF